MTSGIRYSFGGAFPTTIDAKNRLLIQANFRRKLNPERDGEGLTLNISAANRIVIYPQMYYDNVVIPEAEDQIASPEDAVLFEQIYFGLSHTSEPDQQGRILIPQWMLDQTKTGSDVTVVGMDDHLDVWNREDWQKRMADLQLAQSRLRPTNRRVRRAGAVNGPTPGDSETTA